MSVKALFALARLFNCELKRSRIEHVRGHKLAKKLVVLEYGQLHDNGLTVVVISRWSHPRHRYSY